MSKLSHPLLSISLHMTMVFGGAFPMGLALAFVTSNWPIATLLFVFGLSTTLYGFRFFAQREKYYRQKIDDWKRNH